MTRHGIATKPVRDTLPEATLPCASITMTEPDRAVHRHMFPRNRSSRARRNGPIATGAARKMPIHVSARMGSKSKSP